MIDLFDLTLWQKMYFAGIIGGVMFFIEAIGRITDVCKVEYKGFFRECKTSIKTDIERSRKLLRCKHEEKGPTETHDEKT